MAAPVIASSTSGVQAGSGGTSVAVVLPASIAAGELILVFYRHQATGVTTPAGYTLGTSSVAGSGYFWKIAAGTEGGTTLTATYSAGTGRGALTAHRITGAHATPIDAEGTLASVAGPNLTVVPITTTDADRLVIAADNGVDGSSASAISAVASGYTLVIEVAATTATTGTARISVQSITQAAAGSTGSPAFTLVSSTSSFRGFTVAVIPAVVAAPITWAYSQRIGV